MKRGKNFLIILGICLILTTVIYASVNKLNAWHASNGIALRIEGIERTLEYAVNNQALTGSGTYQSSSAVPPGGHSGETIWVSVDGNEKTLLNALASEEGLCGSSPTISYLSHPADLTKPYHFAKEIEITSTKSLQDAIDTGDFCCSPQTGESCTTSCGTLGIRQCDNSCFGYSVQYGYPVQFVGDAWAVPYYYTSVAALDESHFVVIYNDLVGENPGYNTAIVGTISYGGISYSSPVASNQVYTGQGKVFKLDSTHALVLTSSAPDIAKIGTVSGSTITFGNGYSPGSSLPALVPGVDNVAVLDSTHFVMTSYYVAPSPYDPTHLDAKIVLGTISGSAISFSSEYDIPGKYISEVYRLNSNQFVLVYRENVGSEERIKIGTISGSTITFGSGYNIEYAKSGYPNPSLPKITALDATHFVMAFQNSSSTYDSYASVETVSGSTITHGTLQRYNLLWQSKPYSLYALNPTQFLIKSSTEPSYIGQVSGTSISPSVAQFSPSYGLITSVIDEENIVSLYSQSPDARGYYIGWGTIGEITQCN